MRLLSSWDTIDRETLLALCAGSVRESEALEFKSLAPEKGDKGKAEFLKDVCAFANASGGDILYGVAEDDGAASLITGLDEPYDPLTLRLGQLLSSCIEPSLNDVRFKRIDVDDGYVLGLRIPASFHGPHRYHINGQYRFPRRGRALVRDMTYREIEDAFLRQNRSRERALGLRTSALQRIRARKTWKPLIDGPVCLVQIMPIARSTIDIKLAADNWQKLMFIDWGSGSKAFNLDGLVVYPGGGEDELYSFVQLFRDGSVEAFSHAGHFSYESTIPSVGVSNFIRDVIRRSASLYQTLDLYGPALVMVSLINVDGHRLGIGRGVYHHTPPVADRTDMIIPDVLIEDIQQVAALDAALRSILDIVWQAFGLTRCTYFDENGAYNPPA